MPDSAGPSMSLRAAISFSQLRKEIGIESNTRTTIRDACVLFTLLSRR